MIRAFLDLLADESGASMTEYAIIVSLLSVAAMAALIAISGTANASLTQNAGNMTQYEVATPP